MEQTFQHREMTAQATCSSIFVCTLFGTSAVAIKIGLAGVGAFTSAGIRFAIASIVIGLWAGYTKKSFKIHRSHILKLLVISIIFSIQLSAMYLGLTKTDASRATLIINMQPFFLLFLAHLFIPGDRITGKKVLGIALGFAGVVFVFLEKKGIANDIGTGDLIILVCAFLWACNAVYTKRNIHNFEVFHIVFYPMVLSIPIFFLGGFFFDEAMIVNIDAVVGLSLLYQSLVIASYGFIAWNKLLKNYGAVSLHSFIFIIPVSGVAMSGILLNEPVTIKILISLFLIMAGIMVVHTRPAKSVNVEAINTT